MKFVVDTIDTKQNTLLNKNSEALMSKKSLKLMDVPLTAACKSTQRIIMKTKSSSLIFLLIVIALSGCFDLAHITKDEFLQNPAFHEASVITLEEKRYHFKKVHYLLKNDTLHIYGRESLNQTNDVPFQGRVALDRIQSIQIRKVNAWDTIKLVSGIGIGIAMIVFLSEFEVGGPGNLDLSEMFEPLFSRYPR